MANNTVTVKVVRSDGQTFILGTGSSWRILSSGLQGVDYPSFSVYSDKNASGDGSIVTGKHVDDREIQIEARSIDPTNNRALRSSLFSFFSPKYTYKLYVTYLGESVWIDAELEALKCPAENIHRPMKLTIKFYCPTAYFKSVDNYGKDIAAITAGFGFPYFDGPPKYPVYASTFDNNQEVFVPNDGDGPIWPIIRMVFTGDVIAPYVAKSDGTFAKVYGHYQYEAGGYMYFVDGDVLEIDTEAGTVYLNGENYIYKLDWQSDMSNMFIPVGGDTISFDADTGDTNMKVYLFYNKTYLGI